MSCLEFTVLYTHHKAKKSKIWQDGILKMSSEGNKADLFDVHGKHLDSVFLKDHKVEPGDDLESDRFLITVENEKFTDYSNDKPKKKESPKTSSHSLKPFGLPQLQQRVGLKRKPTGFQGPREVPKKAADEIHAPAISSPTKRPYAAASAFHLTSSLFSTSENAIWRNSVTSSKRPGMAFSSLLSSSSMDFPKKVGGNEKCSHPITVDVAAEQLKDKVPIHCLAGDFQTTSGVSVSQNIRSKAKILALLKSNPSSVIEENSVGVAQCHPGAQSRENITNLSSIAIDGCTNTVLEESSEHIQQLHPPSSLSMKCNISKSKWNIYLPQRPTDPSNYIEEKHQEKVPCLHLGLQEPHSQDNVYVCTPQQPHENSIACSNRSVESQQSSWGQNVAPWLLTLGKSDGAQYKSIGNQHVSRYKEKNQTSESNVNKFTEIPNTSSLEGFNYSENGKEICVFQKNTQNGSKARLTDGMRDPNVSPLAASSVCRLSPRMVLESLGDSIEGIDDGFASAGRATMKDTLTVAGDFGDSLQHFAGITFNLLDNFDFADSEEEELQEGSNRPPNSERKVVKNGVKDSEKMANRQGKHDLISDMPPSESPVNGEVLLVDKASMEMDRIVHCGSPVIVLDLQPSKSEYIEQHMHANAESLQSIDDRRKFDLCQVSGVTNSLTVSNVHSGAFEHKGMTNCEFHSQKERSREAELLSQSPVDICFAPTDVSEKDIVHKKVSSPDSSQGYRDPLLTISVKSGDENSRTLIEDKCCTVSSKTDKIQEDVYKIFSQSSGIKHLSEELEACADLSFSISSVSGHKLENAGANGQKRWTNADRCPKLSGLLNGIFLLKDLSEHSTPLESLEMMRGENADLFLKTNGTDDKDDPTREIKD